MVEQPRPTVHCCPGQFRLSATSRSKIRPSYAPGPNTCLITEQNGTVGVCKPVPHGASGSTCVYTCRKGEDCTSTTYGAADSTLALCFEADGFYCDNTAAEPGCKPLLSLGAVCGADDECGSAAYCSSTCKKRSDAGEPCETVPCLAGFNCSVDGKCTLLSFASDATCEGRSLGPY
jgi:hypothetical protein